jgi:hypothetical protein
MRLVLKRISGNWIVGLDKKAYIFFYFEPLWNAVKWKLGSKTRYPFNNEPKCYFPAERPSKQKV